MSSCCCAACGRQFRPRPQVPDQTFCPEPACQRERKRRWQQAKRQQDVDYRQNQGLAQRKWVAAHPDYWRGYRLAHPEYRERERRRKQASRHRAELTGAAKMDVWTRESALASGIYRLQPAAVHGAAKMDAWTVRITVVSDG